jgi:hypothetical protein
MTDETPIGGGTMSHFVQDTILAGCAPGEPDCNQPPPIDGYIIFWGWTLAAVALIAVAAFVTWRVRRNHARAASE